MKDPIIIHLHDGRGRSVSRWLRAIFLYSLLAFCVWLSRDSTWWTLVSGLLFLLTFFSTVASLARESKTEFRSLDELQVWLDRQKVIEALPRGEIIIDPRDSEILRRYGVQAQREKAIQDRGQT